MEISAQMNNPRRRATAKGKARQTSTVDSGFSSDEEMLLHAAQMFEARSSSPSTEATTTDKAQVSAASHVLTCVWHTSATADSGRSRLCRIMQQEKLTRSERELVVLLILRELSIHKMRLREFQDVVKALHLPHREIIRLARSIAYGRLSSSSLLLYVKSDDRGSAIPEVSPIALEAVLAPRRREAARTPITTEEELTFQLSRLGMACREKAETFSEIDQGSDWQLRKLPLLQRRMAVELMQIEHAIKRHPQWFLSPAFIELDLEPNRLVVLLLACKELGLMEAEHDLFTGVGLSRAMSKRADEVGRFMRLLSPRAQLLREDWIQPCGGEETHYNSAPASLAKIEFELTENAMAKLKLARKRSGKTKLGQLVEPRISLERLILPQSARFNLELGLAQVRNAKTLMQDWGLAEHIPYGTAVTMLFYGPPGTGKTAGAEAVAHALGRRILVADISKLKNCFVGNTEKNIAYAFELARQHNAVLFWDEADAMLYDRQMATHSWEISFVNVLLQELERFDGVCILATNRQASMDKALERRISLRIEFPFPDRDTRRRLWEVLIPPKMPLSDDVQLDRLAEYELTGGQIKNVVINAGRMGLAGRTKTILTQTEFERAVQLELNGCLNSHKNKRIGFSSSMVRN